MDGHDPNDPRPPYERGNLPRLAQLFSKDISATGMQLDIKLKPQEISCIDLHGVGVPTCSNVTVMSHDMLESARE